VLFAQRGVGGYVCAGVDSDAAHPGRQPGVEIWAVAVAVTVGAIGDAPVLHLAAAAPESSRNPQPSAGNGGLAW
jgi:hypothetical protein